LVFSGCTSMADLNIKDVNLTGKVVYNVGERVFHYQYPEMELNGKMSRIVGGYTLEGQANDLKISGTIKIDADGKTARFNLAVGALSITDGFFYNGTGNDEFHFMIGKNLFAGYKEYGFGSQTYDLEFDGLTITGINHIAFNKETYNLKITDKAAETEKKITGARVYNVGNDDIALKAEGLNQDELLLFFLMELYHFVGKDLDSLSG
jgi:hypothetical protein